MILKEWVESQNLRNEIIPFLTDSFQKSQKNALNEQAVPSYLNPNILVREIFWLRIIQAYRQAPSGQRVLDFGSGLAAMLPWLQKSYSEIYVYDSNAHVLEHLLRLQKLKTNSFKILTDLNKLQNLPSGYFDSIFALDVLEHVDNLDSILVELKRLLKSNGQLVVSSPTENWIYKFSRNFGGEGYQGEFHVRAAKEVEADLTKIFKVKIKAKIFPIFTFFRIVTATK